MKVFLLKNENSPEDYYRQVLSQGYEPIFLPLLTHSLFVNETIQFLKTEIQKYEVLIITSQRSVECLQTCLESEDFSMEEKDMIFSKPVYTIGPSTYQYLTNIGFTNVRGKDSGNGHKLSELILNEVGDEPILYFTGKIRKDIIPNNMINNRKSFTEFVVYSTDELSDNDIVEKLEPGCWVIFFSSQGTKAIVNHLKDKPYKIGVIGPTTNDYLKENGIQAHLVCASPTADSLYKQLNEQNK